MIIIKNNAIKDFECHGMLGYGDVYFLTLMETRKSTQELTMSKIVRVITFVI